MLSRENFRCTSISKLVSKHILFSGNTSLILDAYLVGYENIIFGSNKGHSINETIRQIKRMAKDRSFNRPVVVVVTKNGCPWCDTTHTAIAYMLRVHDAVTLGEVNHIVVDYTKGSVPLVDGYWVNGGFTDEEKRELLSEAYLHSLKLEERVKRGFRGHVERYTIYSLYRELLKCMTPWGQFKLRKKLNVPCKKLSELIGCDGYLPHLGEVAE